MGTLCGRGRRCIYHVPSALRPRSHSHFFAPLSSPNSAIASRSDPGSFSAAEFCHSLFPPTRLSSPVPGLSHGRSVSLLPSPPLHLFNFILASAISSDKITLADADADADDGNGIIPLNDCPSAPRGMSVAVRARSLCLVAAPPRRPGAVLAFRLLSFVLGENRERSRRSRFPPILGTDRPSARALQALVRHRASSRRARSDFKSCQRVPENLHFNLSSSPSPRLELRQGRERLKNRSISPWIP